MKIEDYRRPKFPRVKKAVAQQLVTDYDKIHEGVSSTVDVNMTAIPRHIASRSEGPSLKAAKAIEERLARAATLSAERRKLSTTPASFAVAAGTWLALQATLAYVGSDKRRLEAFRLRVKEPKNPRDIALAQAVLEGQVPIWDDGSEMMFQSLRQKLDLPDHIEVEIARLAEEEREAREEIAEIRSVVLAGLSGARQENVAQIFAIEDRLAHREIHGNDEAEQATWFETMLKTSTVSDAEIEPSKQIEYQQREAFSFRAVE